MEKIKIKRRRRRRRRRRVTNLNTTLHDLRRSHQPMEQVKEAISIERRNLGTTTTAGVAIVDVRGTSGLRAFAGHCARAEHGKEDLACKEAEVLERYIRAVGANQLSKKNRKKKKQGKK